MTASHLPDTWPTDHLRQQHSCVCGSSSVAQEHCRRRRCCRSSCGGLLGSSTHGVDVPWLPKPGWTCGGLHNTQATCGGLHRQTDLQWPPQTHRQRHQQQGRQHVCSGTHGRAQHASQHAAAPHAIHTSQKKSCKHSRGPTPAAARPALPSPAQPKTLLDTQNKGLSDARHCSQLLPNVHQLTFDLGAGMQRQDTHAHATATTRRQLCCSCQKQPLWIPLRCRARKAKEACAAGDSTHFTQPT